MKKLLLLSAFIIPVLCNAQDVKQDSINKSVAFVLHSQPHGKMVSFTTWAVGDFDPLWSYLLNDLNYKTNQPENAVDIVDTKTGCYAEFIKFNDAQEKQTLKIAFTCKPNGSDITQVKITAPFKLLVEMYIDYFGAHVKDYFPKQGGIDKTYTMTDEVRLYDNCILIVNNKKSFNTN